MDDDGSLVRVGASGAGRKPRAGEAMGGTVGLCPKGMARGSEDHAERNRPAQPLRTRSIHSASRSPRAAASASASMIDFWLLTIVLSSGPVEGGR